MSVITFCQRQPLYDFVKNLARRTPAILLLSAIPAQQKEDEFLRLLALLEPDRFAPDDSESIEQFKTLYDTQAQFEPPPPTLGYSP